MVREYEKNPRGHVWETDEEGVVNVFAYSPGAPHNGPRCRICGYGFCHHCQDSPDRGCVQRKILTRADPVGSEPFDSIEWAFEVHVEEDDRKDCLSAILYGNEDCPVLIEFFASDSPRVEENPLFSWRPKEE